MLFLNDSARTLLMSDDEALPCTDKLSFDTKKEAEAAALTADWQHGTVLKAYQCQHCDLWHLASD